RSKRDWSSDVCSSDLPRQRIIISSTRHHKRKHNSFRVLVGNCLNHCFNYSTRKRSFNGLAAVFIADFYIVTSKATDSFEQILIMSGKWSSINSSFSLSGNNVVLITGS